MTKTVAIVQSNYVPWKGYFDLIRRADEFVLYDDVQYTRRDWRNRNRIKTAHGSQWLTIPVETKGNYLQKIKDTRVSDPLWGNTHWQTLYHSYGRAPYFKLFAEWFEELYRTNTGPFLSDINREWIVTLCELLGVRTAITQSMDYRLTADDPTERLLEICLQAGATTYLSGPAARAYLDETPFRAAGIDVQYMDYAGYLEYPQLYPPFDHAVTALDLLFMTGPQAPAYLERVRHAA